MSSWGRGKGHLELAVSNFLEVIWSSGKQPPDQLSDGGSAWKEELAPCVRACLRACARPSVRESGDAE